MHPLEKPGSLQAATARRTCTSRGNPPLARIFEFQPQKRVNNFDLNLNGFVGQGPAHSSGKIQPRPKKRFISQAGTEESPNLQMFKVAPAHQQSQIEPYLLLSSKELDVMIYYHKKFLRQVQKERLKRLTDEDRLQKVTQHFKGEPLLVTTVDIEKKSKEEAPGEAGLAPEAVDGQQKAQLRSQSMQAMRPRRQKAAQEGEPGAKWQKKKKAQKFLLDFRRVQPDGQVLSETDQQSRLKKAYLQQPVPNRATYFRPTLKIKRNPQMKLIETYFVASTDQADCKLDFIRNIPLIKLPPLIEIDRQSKVQLP